MAKRVSRKLELFTIHAHKINAFDYVEIFNAFSSIPKKRRISDINGIVVGFPHITKIENGYFVQAVEGDPDAHQMVYDLTTGEAKESDLVRKKYLVGLHIL